MKRNVYIDPTFEFLRDYIEQIPNRFDDLGTVLYNKRNIVREDRVSDTRLVIKSYRRIYLPNRIRYTYFYPSKAQRAFDYARLLLKEGFNTPRPIAYIECIHHGLLRESYFISEYTDFQPLNSVLSLPITELRGLLEGFARHTYEMHRKNIYHVDYNTSNILFKKVNDQYSFALIDNNRMKFGTVSFNKGVRNLERLGLPVEMLAFIGKEYGRLRNRHEIVSLERLFHYKRTQLRKRNIKKAVKHPINWLHTTF